MGLELGEVFPNGFEDGGGLSGGNYGVPIGKVFHIMIVLYTQVGFDLDEKG